MAKTKSPNAVAPTTGRALKLPHPRGADGSRNAPLKMQNEHLRNQTVEAAAYKLHKCIKRLPEVAAYVQSNTWGRCRIWAHLPCSAGANLPALYR